MSLQINRKHDCFSWVLFVSDLQNSEQLVMFYNQAANNRRLRIQSIQVVAVCLTFRKFIGSWLGVYFYN